MRRIRYLDISSSSIHRRVDLRVCLCVSTRVIQFHATRFINRFYARLRCAILCTVMYAVVSNRRVHGAKRNNGSGVRIRGIDVVFISSSTFARGVTIGGF